MDSHHSLSQPFILLRTIETDVCTTPKASASLTRPRRCRGDRQSPQHPILSKFMLNSAGTSLRTRDPSTHVERPCSRLGFHTQTCAGSNKWQSGEQALMQRVSVARELALAWCQVACDHGGGGAVALMSATASAIRSGLSVSRSKVSGASRCQTCRMPPDSQPTQARLAGRNASEFEGGHCTWWRWGTGEERVST